MIVGNISAYEMQDNVQDAINGSDAECAVTDALVHVSWLITGTKTAEELSDVQDEILGHGVTTEYLDSYSKTWRSLYDMIF
jgi:type VI protein secretion system component VasK